MGKFYKQLFLYYMITVDPFDPEATLDPWLIKLFKIDVAYKNIRMYALHDPDALGIGFPKKATERCSNAIRACVQAERSETYFVFYSMKEKKVKFNAKAYEALLTMYPSGSTYHSSVIQNLKGDGFVLNGSQVELADNAAV